MDHPYTGGDQRGVSLAGIVQDRRASPTNLHQPQRRSGPSPGSNLSAKANSRPKGERLELLLVVLPTKQPLFRRRQTTPCDAL